MGIFAVAGHHYMIVASADGLQSTTAAHHDVVPHPGQDHPVPASTVVEAHSPTPIIQKFQLQKQLEVGSTLSMSTFANDPPFQAVHHIQALANVAPLRLPLDLKTTFLN